MSRVLASARSLALSALCLGGAAVAQTATIPNPPSPQNLDRPFPGGIGRYQQWFSASSLTAAYNTPRRLEQIEFFAGSGQTSNAAGIDMEVSIGKGFGFGVTGTFDTNFAETPTIVVPRRNVQLLAAGPGQVCMTVPFNVRYTWDGQSPLLLEIKIFGNTRGNQPFAYDLRGTTNAQGTTSRVYVQGSAIGPTGTNQTGWGLVTRFTARPGVILNNGAGCPGEGGFVPQNGMVQIPSPGINWTQTLTNASSQRLALWAIGDSGTQFGPSPLPADLGVLLGLGPTGCNLRTNAVATQFVTTIGGGPGGGSANLVVPLPGIASYVGMELFTQWVVADPLTVNGLLSASNGLRAIVAPVGG